MQTTLFEVKFYDGRIYRIFCKGRNQIKRFVEFTNKLKIEIESISEISKGIHEISDFEKLQPKN